MHRQLKQRIKENNWDFITFEPPASFPLLGSMPALHSMNFFKPSPPPPPLPPLNPLHQSSCVLWGVP